MDERSIAEIIGKAEQLGHRHPQGADGDCIAYECQTCLEWVSEYAEQTLCPANWTNDYTVDDLLAWLLRDAETQDGVDLAIYWNTDDIEYFPGRTFYVHITVCDDNGDPHEHVDSEGPTLLAALEAAVRTVDVAITSPKSA